MLVHTFDPCTHEAEAGWTLSVRGHPGLNLFDGWGKVEEKTEVLLLITCDPSITVLQPSIHLDPTSTCNGDGVDPVDYKNNACSAQNAPLDPIITLDIFTGYARRPYADPEPAPCHHTSDTMDLFSNADPVFKACLRAEHKCGRFTTDQESSLVPVPCDTPEPTQDINK
ncbi:hypothetical protein STEG23_014575, partial [Scotinomys teguina]